MYESNLVDGMIVWCCSYWIELEDMIVHKKEPYKCMVKYTTSRNYPCGGWFVYELNKKEEIIKSSKVEFGSRRCYYTYDECKADYNASVDDSLKEIEEYIEEKNDIIE